MNKARFFQLLYVVLILSLIAFMIFMVVWLKSEGKTCVGNPMAYFEGKNEGSSCYCVDMNNAIYDFGEG